MKTICLTLDKRLEYVENYIVPEFKKRFNIDVRKFIVGDRSFELDYDYIDDPHSIPVHYNNSTTYPTWFSPPAYNAWKSHRAIFEKFIDTKEDFFLLLEDDIVVEDDFEEILGDNLDELTKTLSFDMLYLGSYNATKKGYLESPHILSLPRCSDVGGFHAVILSKKVVYRLLELSPLGPFDWMSSRFIHGNNFRSLAVTPSVITQKSGYSYVEGSYLNKPDRSV